MHQQPVLVGYTIHTGHQEKICKSGSYSSGFTWLEYSETLSKPVRSSCLYDIWYSQSRKLSRSMSWSSSTTHMDREQCITNAPNWNKCFLAHERCRTNQQNRNERQQVMSNLENTNIFLDGEKIKTVPTEKTTNFQGSSKIQTFAWHVCEIRITSLDDTAKTSNHGQNKDTTKRWIQS